MEAPKVCHSLTNHERLVSDAMDRYSAKETRQRFKLARQGARWTRIQVHNPEILIGQFLKEI